MTMTCPNCIYYNSTDSTCRHNSPRTTLESVGGGQTFSLYWPPVKDIDWCAEGWNETDGSYDMKPPLPVIQPGTDVTGKKV